MDGPVSGEQIKAQAVGHKIGFCTNAEGARICSVINESVVMPVFNLAQ